MCLSEIQQRVQTADQRLKAIADEEAALATQELNQSDIQSVLADFDGPGGNVAITFHPSGLKSLTQEPLETAE